VTLLEVGRVVRPHGLAGEVLVELVSNRPERLARGSVLEGADTDLEVESSRPHGGRHLVRFVGISDRLAAEELRGVALVAPPLEDPAALWIHELVGSRVEEADGRVVGTVAAVEANPASDLLVLEGGGLVPLRFVRQRWPGRVVVELPSGLLD
jgi:16S rRNA processing protein RimM